MRFPWHVGSDGPIIGESPESSDAGKLLGVNAAGLVVFLDAATYVINARDPNAYTTIQAALDAAEAVRVAGGAGSAVLQVVGGGTYTENLVIPPDLDVKLYSEFGLYDTYIDGTITWNPTANKTLVLQGIEQGGAVSGAATGSNNCLVALGMGFDSTITFTGGVVRIVADGGTGYSAGMQGYFGGAVDSTGSLILLNCGIDHTLTSAQEITLVGCRMVGARTYSTADTVIRMTGCLIPSGIKTLAFSGAAGVATVDSFTLSQLLGVGLVAPTNGRVACQPAVALGGAGDIGGVLWMRFPITAGGGGAADDVSLLAPNRLPFNARIADAFMKVTGAVGGSTVSLRSAAGGAGTLYATMATAAATLNRGTVNDDPTIAAGGPLFLRRSDSAVAGSLYVMFQML